MKWRPLGMAAGALACLIGYTPAPGMALPEVVALRTYRPPNYFVMHHDFTGRTAEVLSARDARVSQVRMVRGLADAKCVSFETVSPPDHYYKHAYSRIVLAKRLDEPRFRADSTFCVEKGLEKSRTVGIEAVSLRSYNQPDRFIRHRHGELWLDPRAETSDYRASATFFIVPGAQVMGTEVRP
jgi:hypothetical protein